MYTVSKNEVLFPVEKIKATDVIQGMEFNSDYNHMIIANDNQVLNVCSERYNLVKNTEILPRIEAVLDQYGIDYEFNARMASDKARFKFTYRLKDQSLAIGKGDIINPKIDIYHSYNGLVSYSMNMGYFRLICSNGLSIPILKDEKGRKLNNFSAKGRHTTKLSENLNSLEAELNDLLDMRTTHNKVIKEIFKGMNSEKLPSWENRLIEVLEANKLPSIEENKAIGKYESDFMVFIKDTVISEADQLNPNETVVTDWLIYNGINNAIYNNEFNSKADNVRATIDQNVLTYMLEN